MADAAHGYILDGFPRTLAQAEALAKMVHVTVALDIDMPESAILQTTIGRRACARCGEGYNIATIKVRPISPLSYMSCPRVSLSHMCSPCLPPSTLPSTLLPSLMTPPRRSASTSSRPCCRACRASATSAAAASSSVLTTQRYDIHCPMRGSCTHRLSRLTSIHVLSLL